MSPEFLLSTIVFLPAIAGLGIMLIPSEQKDAIRWATLAITAVVMALIVGILIFPNE
jgi:NADH:ubiquinone oxidoreductase subunit 4 (subunit M)